MNKESEVVKLIRVSPDFDKEIKEIAKKRIETKHVPLWDHSITSRRITEALPRHPFWNKIKNDVINADLPKRNVTPKKGNIPAMLGGFAGILMFVIVAIAIVLVAALWIYGFGKVTDSVTSVPDTSSLNISKYTNITFGNLNIGFQQFRWWSLAIIFGMVMGIFVSNFLVKAHPAFFGLYILLCIIAVTLSIFLAAAFEKLYSGGGLVGESLQGFGASSWVILNLPIVTAILALIGGAFMFISISRDPEGGSII